MTLWNLIHGCHRKSEGCKHLLRLHSRWAAWHRHEYRAQDHYIQPSDEKEQEWRVEDSCRNDGDDVLLVRLLHRRNGRMERGSMADDSETTGLAVLYGDETP